VEEFLPSARIAHNTIQYFVLVAGLEGGVPETSSCSTLHIVWSTYAKQTIVLCSKNP
jgi:hypothetical protein